MRRVAVLVACLAVGCASHGHPALAVPPERGGAVHLCPTGAPVRAYAGRFYPVNFPTPPAITRRPGRCFGSVTEAVRAGDVMAATPPGDHLLGGIYLVRSGRGLLSLCAKQSRVAGFAVPCPTLIPGTSTDVYCPGGAICAERGAFVLEGTFRGPPDYHGVERGSGHLWIIAFGRRSGVWPGSTLLGGHQVGRTQVDGKPARIVEFPPGSALNSGHVAIIWRRGSMTFAVTLHGHTLLNERLDLLIASHLRFARVSGSYTLDRGE